MTFKLYDALGVPQNASKEDIKRAYRKLAVQCHPDKGGDPEKFKEISNAYAILHDDEKRARYDQIGDMGMENGGMNAGQGGMPFETMDPRHIFEQFFGGMPGFHFGDQFGDFERRPAPVRRADHVHQIKISLADAYHGCQKMIRVSLQKTCMQCREKCHACQGKGSITDMRRMGFFTQMMTRPCDHCAGTGMMSRGKPSCTECQGTATYLEEKKQEVTIPRGVASGHQIRIKGCGEQTKDPAETAGDLVLQIHIQDDPNFQRVGSDLIYKIPLSFGESVLGKKITIPHFDVPIEIDTSSFGICKPEKAYVLEGKGMPLSGSNQFGKLMLIFQIAYPTKALSQEQKEKLQTAFAEVGLD